MINDINPKIYNFKNLKLEDQKIIASKFEIFLIIKKEKDDLKETAKKQNSLTKFLYEQWSVLLKTMIFLLKN